MRDAGDWFGGLNDYDQNKENEARSRVEEVDEMDGMVVMMAPGVGMRTFKFDDVFLVQRPKVVCASTGSTIALSSMVQVRQS